MSQKAFNERILALRRQKQQTPNKDKTISLDYNIEAKSATAESVYYDNLSTSSLSSNEDVYNNSDTYKASDINLDSVLSSSASFSDAYFPPSVTNNNHVSVLSSTASISDSLQDSQGNWNNRGSSLDIIDSYIEQMESEMDEINYTDDEEFLPSPSIYPPTLNIKDRGVVITKEKGFVIETTKLKRPPQSELSSLQVPIRNDDSVIYEASTASYDYTTGDVAQKNTLQSLRSVNNVESYVSENSIYEDTLSRSNTSGSAYMMSISEPVEFEVKNNGTNPSPQDIYPRTKAIRAKSMKSVQLNAPNTSAQPFKSALKQKPDKSANYERILIVCGIFGILMSILLFSIIPVSVYNQSCFNNVASCKANFLKECQATSSCTVIDADATGCICAKSCSCTTSKCRTKFVYPEILNSSSSAVPLNPDLLSNALEILNLDCDKQNKLIPLNSDSKKLIMSYYISISPNLDKIQAFAKMLQTQTEFDFETFHVDSEKKQITVNSNTVPTSFTNAFASAIRPTLSNIYTSSKILSGLKTKALNSFFTDKLKLTSDDVDRFKTNFVQSNILLSVDPKNVNNLLTDPIRAAGCASNNNQFQSAFNIKVPCNNNPQIGVFNFKRIVSGDSNGAFKQFGMFLSNYKPQSIISMIHPANITGFHQDQVGLVTDMDHVIFDYLMSLDVRVAFNMVSFVEQGDSTARITDISPPPLYSFIFANIAPNRADSYTMSLTLDNTNSTGLLIGSNEMVRARTYLNSSNIPFIIAYQSDSVQDSSNLNSIWNNSNAAPDDLWAQINQ